MGKIKVLQILLFILGEFVLNNDAAKFMSCSESDQDALHDFKNGLEDPENWLSSWKGSRCCQWKGISCDNITGAVIALDLHNPHPEGPDSSSGRFVYSNISGEIRPSLLKLKSLKHLDLSFNTFFGNPIPEFFGSLKNLQYLNLSNAGFSGTIPPTLGNLSSLQCLDVRSLSIVVTDFEWVNGLVSLKYLLMDGVDLSGLAGPDWVRPLNRLPSLTELHLSSCSLSSIPPPPTFVNFTSLALIDLSFNNLEYSRMPEWLVNVSSLVSVDISNSGLSGGIPLGFGELPNLQFLYLGMNHNLTANCSQFFSSRWEKIQVLDLRSNKLYGKLPSSIANMTFLTDLDLLENNVEGVIPSSIGKLCNLRSLHIVSNNLTGALPEFLQGGENCHSRSPLPSLQVLDLSNNHLVGKLPEWLGHLKNLVHLYLFQNSLYGPIPASLGLAKNLTDLGLGGNKLNGTLPESLGQLSELIFLDVSDNHLTGTVTETHFLKQGKLKHLQLAFNSFLTLNVSSSWVPPFQVQSLFLSSCHLGPSFPAWLKSQKKVEYLDFSNASISGSIPHWFWEHSSKLSWLNVSFNQLEGALPNPLNLAPLALVDFSSNLFKGNIPLPSVSIYLLDLSKNKLSGSIPKNISDSLLFLSISDNQIDGEIPASIANSPFLKVIDLSGNNLTGSIPSSIGNCEYLEALDLSKNKLSGNIPASLGQLSTLQTLHLNDNKLTGELPSSFQSLTSLETLDLGNNRLKGKIPLWIGKGFKSLRILSLRSNSFSGKLPPELSNLTSIQVLDLAGNQFNGSIPASFGDLKGMTQVQKTKRYQLYGTMGSYYEDNLVVNMKGQLLRYTKTLSLLISLDLSGNNLSGDLPEEITKLSGLVVLNLSRNHISGHIPRGISKLKQLSSLDLSSNRLSGAIPQSLASLSFLGYLNLSNNEFSGKVPYSDHVTTFDATSFAGNPGLCGAPLVIKCLGDNSGKTWSPKENSVDGFHDKWFYLIIGFGFTAGILIPYLVLKSRTWNDAYFGFVDSVVERISWLGRRRTMYQRTGHCPQ